MKSDEFLDRLEQAVMLESDDAAIRMQATFAPQAGPRAKVFPPTYIETGGTKYHFERRWDGEDDPVDVVILDSYQSQANRVEAALREEAEQLGLPQIVLQAVLRDRTISISTLDAPHRSRDAYFLDSEIDGIPFDKTDVGKALAEVSQDDATPALRHAPYDLVYGVWDSHRGKRVAVKFPRVYTSEMIGWRAVAGKRAATKGDPVNLESTTKVPMKDWRPDTQSAQKKKGDQKLSEIGHGMIPGQVDEAVGGVSVRSISREGVLSLTGLSRLRFGTPDATRAGRVALAALALAGDRLAFGRAGLNLRSGADLVRMTDRLEWVQAGAQTEPFELPLHDARELLAAARERLAAAGVEWTGEPIMVTPASRLREFIERAFYVPTLDPEA